MIKTATLDKDQKPTDEMLREIREAAKKEIVFTQKMSLQGGEYLLSLGVTGYERDKFEVYHSLYDVLNLTVISDKDTVGFYDMGTNAEVHDRTE